MRDTPGPQFESGPGYFFSCNSRSMVFNKVFFNRGLENFNQTMSFRMWMLKIFEGMEEE